MLDDTCPSCSRSGPLDRIEHEPWCPHFLRGLEGDAGQMTFGHSAKVRTPCALCGRELPRNERGELEPAVVYSARTGARYCPPRLEQSCRAIHDRQRASVLAGQEV